MKTRRSLLGCFAAAAAVAAGIAVSLRARAAPESERPFSIIHSHQSLESAPRSPLVSDGAGNLYGTTAAGGPVDGGALFTVRTDGSGLRVLHTFSGGTDDGSVPEAGLLLDGGTLYGATAHGGAAGLGTLFAIATDATGFRILHSFSGGADDGSRPYASLIADASGHLYGTTMYGGGSDFGTIFRVGMDGAGYEVLHAFRGGVGDGRFPLWPMTLGADGTLFGTTDAGGQQGVYVQCVPNVHPCGWLDGTGVVFRIGADGAGFRVLRAFPSEGPPSGSLVLDRTGHLHGTLVALGGSGGIFAMGQDGSGLEVLHLFAAPYGSFPHGSLTLDGSDTLYGTTTSGGESSGATLFRVRTDGKDFRVLHEFDDASRGFSPNGSLVLDSSGVLFGTAEFGGATSAGTVFAVNSDGTGFETLLDFPGWTVDGTRPWASLIEDAAGNLYGTTLFGGASGSGTIFTVQPDGSGFRLLHTFTGDDGYEPMASLVLGASGYLYGTAESGGPSGGGVAFRLRTDGTSFEVLHAFSFSPVSGAAPFSSLTLDGSGNVYGTTAGGGPSGYGAVFRMRTDGTAFELLHVFPGPEAGQGSAPQASLVLDALGRNLYGTTFEGSAFVLGDGGTVFTLRTDGTGFRLLHSFREGADDGLDPWASLILDSSGYLYGTTGRGGTAGKGTVFRVRTGGADFQVLHSFGFDPNDGATPVSPLALDGSGSLYGTTSEGGAWHAGTVFTVRTDGSGYQLLHAFTGVGGDGSNPRAGLLLDRTGHAIGTTENGGSAGYGSEFMLLVGKKPVTSFGPAVPVRKR